MTDTDSDTRIAFIGIGLMGSRMADRLLDAGFSLSVWNRSPDKCAPLVAKGARQAASVADAVSDADVAITMLAGAAAIEEVYFGANGIVAAAPASCLLIDMSSVAPDYAREIHWRLSGAGQICKLVNQTIVHVFIGAVTEGLMLATSLGVDAAKVREAIGGGFCQSRILEIHGQRMIDRDFVPGGPLEFSVKDLNKAAEMAEGAALDLPLTRAVLDEYRGLVDSGRGGYDHSALLLAYEEANAPHRISPGKSDRLP